LEDIEMHHDLEMLKDPVFWRALAIGVLPVVASGATLVWLGF
jgi:hypothetical protein